VKQLVAGFDRGHEFLLPAVKVLLGKFIGSRAPWQAQSHAQNQYPER